MEFNTFNDRDTERIGAVVRRVESKVSVPFDRRPPPVPSSRNLIRIKTKASCAASNATTGQMSSVSCDVFCVNPSTGALTDLGYDLTVWNPGGAIESGKFGSCWYNDYGMLEFVVIRCGS